MPRQIPSLGAAFVSACALLASGLAPGVAHADDQGQTLFSTPYQAQSSFAAASAPSPGNYWRTTQVPNHGDEANGIRERSRMQITAAPGATDDPLRPTSGAMRVELRPYDDPSIAGPADGDVTDTGGYLANRAEVYDRIATRATPNSRWPDPIGSTRYYSFSVFFPEDFTFQNAWMDITQWKGLNTGSPPVALEVDRDKLELGGATIRRPLGGIARGRWTSFVFGIHFDSDPSAGWVQVWRDGAVVLPQTAMQTARTFSKDGATVVDPNYLKQGIYRSTAWTSTNVLYFGPMQIGTTEASVGLGTSPSPTPSATPPSTTTTSPSGPAPTTTPAPAPATTAPPTTTTAAAPPATPATTTTATTPTTTTVPPTSTTPAPPASQAAALVTTQTVAAMGPSMAPVTSTPASSTASAASAQPTTATTASLPSASAGEEEALPSTAPADTSSAAPAPAAGQVAPSAPTAPSFVPIQIKSVQLPRRLAAGARAGLTVQLNASAARTTSRGLAIYMKESGSSRWKALRVTLRPIGSSLTGTFRVPVLPAGRLLEVRVKASTRELRGTAVSRLRIAR